MTKDKLNPHAVALSKLGASKGGKARLTNLSDEALSRIGRLGASIRWKGHRKAP